MLTSLAPMISALAGGIVAMLLSSWDRRTASIIAAFAGLSAGASYAWTSVASEPVMTQAVGTGGWFSAIVACCLALGAVAVVVGSRSAAATAAGARVPVLTAFAAAAAATLGASLDLLVLFLSVEVLALSGYALVSSAASDRSDEAAMKWFVQGSVATSVLIIGIGVLVSLTGGHLSYAALASASEGPGSSVALGVGSMLVLSALAFKAGAFPFHGWMPDAFETAPPVGALILASLGKVGPIAAMVWFASAIEATRAGRALTLIAAIAAASIVFGNLAALRQRSLARMLAYSGIAQIGYALAGVPVVGAERAVLSFAVLYGLTSAASFGFVIALHEADRTWDGSVSGLRGLSGRHPALAVSLVATMLSLTGIPMTAGFWGKFLVFSAASSDGYLWLTIVGMLGSVVSFGYYGAVLRSAFMEPEKGSAAETGSSQQRTSRRPGVAQIATILLASMIVLAGVVPLAIGLGPFFR